MPVTPRGYLYGPPLSAAVEGQAAYEGALGGLANLGQTIMQAQQLGPAGDAAYLARTVGGQKLGEAAGKLTGGLTYGGGDALRQIFAGLPAGGAGGKGGRGALQMALDPQPIHVVQDEASRLHELAVAFQDAERRRALDMTPLGRAVAPQAATEGLRNVPAERLGLDPRLVVRPDTISQLADLVGRKDPSARSMLIAEGLDPNMTAEDLAGLAAKSRLYASELASRSGRKQKERAAIDLSGRTLLMKSRLAQMGYDADNIDMVAAELAKLGDDAARFALDELGRPTKFGHELALAKRRAHRVTTVINKYVGLPEKGTSGGAGGGRSASELGKQLRHLDDKILATEKAGQDAGAFTAGQKANLDTWRAERLQVVADWNRAYLSESQGPAGKALTAEEEAAALWRSGADYHQALTRMKERHPDVNHVGLLFNYGKRDAWNKARDTAPAPAPPTLRGEGKLGVVDVLHNKEYQRLPHKSPNIASSAFGKWFEGQPEDEKIRIEGGIEQAAASYIDIGKGSDEDFARSLQEKAPPGHVLLQPGADRWMVAIFNVVDRQKKGKVIPGRWEPKTVIHPLNPDYGDMYAAMSPEEQRRNWDAMTAKERALPWITDPTVGAPAKTGAVPGTTTTTTTVGAGVSDPHKWARDSGLNFIEGESSDSLGPFAVKLKGLGGWTTPTRGQVPEYEVWQAKQNVRLGEERRREPERMVAEARAREEAYRKERAERAEFRRLPQGQKEVIYEERNWETAQYEGSRDGDDALNPKMGGVEGYDRRLEEGLWLEPVRGMDQYATQRGDRTWDKGDVADATAKWKDNRADAEARWWEMLREIDSLSRLDAEGNETWDDYSIVLHGKHSARPHLGKGAAEGRDALSYSGGGQFGERTSTDEIRQRISDLEEDFHYLWARKRPSLSTRGSAKGAASRKDIQKYDAARTWLRGLRHELDRPGTGEHYWEFGEDEKGNRVLSTEI